VDVFAILLLAMAHALVDTFALMIQPLWPDLQTNLSLSDPAIQAVYLLWTLCTSMTQFVFAYLGDRRQVRWLIWGGTTLAVLSIGMIGQCSNAAQLVCLLIIGGLGVGAFHPEAAALVGSLAPTHRSRAMSLFVVGGGLGLALGPLYSGSVTARYGLAALVWSIPWGLALVAMLAVCLRRLPAPAVPAPQRRSLPISQVVQGKGWLVALVLAIGTLRVVPAVGILQTLAFMLKAHGASNAKIGLAQTVFQSASTVGALLCALCIQRKNERLALWLLPILGAPALALCVGASYEMLLLNLSIVGLVIGGAGPVLISFAQELLPGGQRLASSLTMGVSWGLGGAVVAGMMLVLNEIGRPELAFLCYAPAILISSLLCAWLPSAHQIPAPAAATPT
jgi:FSR family fosmidomycin resistance protein-like MFS transporter